MIPIKFLTIGSILVQKRRRYKNKEVFTFLFILISYNVYGMRLGEFSWACISSYTLLQIDLTNGEREG